jgi:hypothetical protein
VDETTDKHETFLNRRQQLIPLPCCYSILFTEKWAFCVIQFLQVNSMRREKREVFRRCGKDSTQPMSIYIWCEQLENKVFIYNGKIPGRPRVTNGIAQHVMGFL